MIEIILTSLVLVGAVFVIGWFFRTRHINLRREDRKCMYLKNIDGIVVRCDSYTNRHYRMIHDEIARPSRWGQWFHWYVLDECEQCGHVYLIKGGPTSSKFFNSLKISWRRIIDPDQFLSGEELFARAGIIPEAIPPIAERVRRAAREVRNRAGREKARLDKPVRIEVSRTHTQTQGFKVWIIPSVLAQHTIHKPRLPKD